MFHRFSTWWRALSVVLLGLAAVTWPSAAQAGTTTTFKVSHQGAWVALSSSGRARLRVTLDLPTAHDKAVAQLSLYPRVVTRSQLTPITSGAGIHTKPSTTTALIDLDCATHRSISITVGLYARTPGRVAGICGSRSPRLHLACAEAQCDGVYPLSYTLTINGVTTTKWSLVAIEATRVARPLFLNWIETFQPSILHRTSRAIAVLDTIANDRSIPITLSADYRTLARLMPVATTPSSEQMDAALVRALASPLHRVVVAPPGNIDFGGLVANGLTTQVAQQLSLTATFLKTITGHFVDPQVLLSGRPSLSSLDALAGAGVRVADHRSRGLPRAPRSRTSPAAAPHRQSSGADWLAISLAGSRKKGNVPPGWNSMPMTRSWDAVSMAKQPVRGPVRPATPQEVYRSRWSAS